MYIALRNLKIDTGETDDDGKRIIEIRKPGEAVPEAARWSNLSIWVMRGDITDKNGCVWRNRLKTGKQLTVGDTAPDPTPGKRARRGPRPGVDVKLVDTIPTLEEVLAAGYSERQASGIIARQTALARGDKEELASEAAFHAMEAWDEAHPEPEPDFDNFRCFIDPESTINAGDRFVIGAQTGLARLATLDDTDTFVASGSDQGFVLFNAPHDYEIPAPPESSGLEELEDAPDHGLGLTIDPSLTASSNEIATTEDELAELTKNATVDEGSGVWPSEPPSDDEDGTEVPTHEAPPDEPAAPTKRQLKRAKALADKRGRGGVMGAPGSGEVATIEIPEPAPDKAEPPKLTRKQLNKMTKAELLTAADDRGFKVSIRSKNSDLVKAILKSQE